MASWFCKLRITQIAPNNHLREINLKEFSCLDAESVNFSSNAFKTFPKELSKFSNLKTIDLSNNPIKSLGGELTGSEPGVIDPKQFEYLTWKLFRICTEWRWRCLSIPRRREIWKLWRTWLCWRCCIFLFEIIGIGLVFWQWIVLSFRSSLLWLPKS